MTVRQGKLHAQMKERVERGKEGNGRTRGPSRSGCRTRPQTTPSRPGQEPVVVSVEGYGVTRSRQVRADKASASEPLMTCRKRKVTSKPGGSR